MTKVIDAFGTSRCGEIGHSSLSRITKPASRYVPFGEYLGPPATFIGWAGKALMAPAAIVDAVRGFPDHPLSRRSNQIKSALHITSHPTKDKIPGGVLPQRDQDQKTDDDSPPPPPPPPPGGNAISEVGGVDFTFLELRYLTEFRDGPMYFLGTAFRTIPSFSESKVDPQALGELSWAFFFVCLAMDSNTFWVNLNPSEPERIIDYELGKTDVGRVLLTADFQMKKDLAQLTHPKESEIGRRFWNKIYERAMRFHSDGSIQIAIPVAFRVWIVPGEILIASSDESIYIVDAQMEVKIESEYFNKMMKGQSSELRARQQISEIQEYAEDMVKSQILPELVKAVNLAPQYQELRQVFLSRIVAEWYKTRHHSSQQAFLNIVEKRRTDSWPSSLTWSPSAIFQLYKDSLIKGEYSLTEENETINGNYIVNNNKKVLYRWN